MNDTRLISLAGTRDDPTTDPYSPQKTSHCRGGRSVVINARKRYITAFYIIIMIYNDDDD